MLGVVIALVNKISNRKPPEATGCAACPNRESCISVETAAAVPTEKPIIKANVEKPVEKATEKVDEKPTEKAAEKTEKKEENK